MLRPLLECQASPQSKDAVLLTQITLIFCWHDSKECEVELRRYLLDPLSHLNPYDILQPCFTKSSEPKRTGLTGWRTLSATSNISRQACQPLHLLPAVLIQTSSFACRAQVGWLGVFALLLAAASRAGIHI